MKPDQRGGETLFHANPPEKEQRAMTEKKQMIFKDDGFPLTALLTGYGTVIVQPPNDGSWLCLQIQTAPHEAQEVQDRISEAVPPERIQLALDPMTAHQLGLHLIEAAKQATDAGA